MSSTLTIAAIPGAGVIETVFILVPTIVDMVEKICSAQGFDSKKIVKIKDQYICLKNHPLSNHAHTLNPEDFPYKDTSVITNTFNTLAHKITGAFQNYAQKKEWFYKTINQEMQLCAWDYFRLNLEDALINAWVTYQVDQNPTKALAQINQAIETAKDASEPAYRYISREILLLKAFLLKKLGQFDEAYSLQDTLHQVALSNPVSLKRQKMAISILLQIAQESSKSSLKGLNQIQIESQKILKLLEDCSKTTEQIKLEAIAKRPTFCHALTFLELLFENIRIIEKHKLWDQLPQSQTRIEEIKTASSFSVSILESLYQDFTRKFIQIPDDKDLLTYIKNSALLASSMSALAHFLSL